VPLPLCTHQVVLTLLGVAGVAMWTAGLPGPGAIILGGSLAMSSTAVAIQVGRGENRKLVSCEMLW
jgi:hypothetical protein